MIELSATACIDAPAAKVWKVLSSLESIQLWVPSIQHSYCPAQSRGVGALRICELKQFTVRETIVEWEEGRAFTYSGIGAPMMKEAINRWSIAPHGEQTLVTSTAQVVLKGGLFGRLLEPMVKSVATRAGAQSLASLKYLVEHGEPWSRPQRELALAPAGC